MKEDKANIDKKLVDKISLLLLDYLPIDKDLGYLNGLAREIYFVIVNDK